MGVAPRQLPGGEATGSGTRSAVDRLDSWKGIAAYLGRDVRTVQRWEDRSGLPVYRHTPGRRKGSPVCAYRSELDSWLRLNPRAPAALADAPAARLNVPPPRPRLLVLPLLNVSDDREQDALVSAITEGLIASLARLGPEHLAVIARTTSMHYRRSHKDVTQIARAVRADYVLEASFRRTEDRLIISARLVRADDQAYAWAERYDIDVANLSATEEEIATAIVSHIGAAGGAGCAEVSAVWGC